MILSPTSLTPFLCLNNVPTSPVSQTTEPIAARQAASLRWLSINTETEQGEQNWAVKKARLKRDARYLVWGLCTHCFGAI